MNTINASKLRTLIQITFILNAANVTSNLHTNKL